MAGSRLISPLGPLIAGGGAFVPTAPPVISGILTLSGVEGRTIAIYRIRASNRPTKFDAVGLPTGLVLNELNGQITGIPGPGTAGTHSVTLTAENIVGTSAPATLTITITAAPQIPVVSPGAITGTTGVAITPFQIVATPGPILSYSITPALPIALSLDAMSGEITGVPAAAINTTFQMRARNAAGQSAPATLTVTITAALAAPVITSTLVRSGVEGTAFSYTLTATGNPTPSLNATGLPAWLSFTSPNITGTLPAHPSGPHSITLIADNTQGSDTQTLVLTITEALGWEVTNQTPGGLAVITQAATEAALGPVSDWTGWQPAFAADVTDDLYNAVSPAAQTVRLFSHFAPYTLGTEREVPFDNFFNPMPGSNEIREWGYNSVTNSVYLNGGSNATGSPIRLRLVKAP